MPAKVVYGKNKKKAQQRGQQQTLSFEGFLSPRKAGVVVGVECGDEGVGRNWRGEGDERDKDGVGRRGGVKGVEKVGGRKEGGVKVEKTKEAAAMIEEGLERSMEKLCIGGKIQEESGLEGKKERKSRKALGAEDGNTVVEGERNKVAKEKKPRKGEEAESIKPATPALQPEPEPDLRVRTPRRTPRRTPKAKRRVELTPASRPEPAQLLTPEPTPEPEDIYSAYVSPLLALSDRKTLVTFEDWAKELEPHFEVTKIAEASFSEVYRLSATSPTPDGKKAESVLKVVALKTPPFTPYPCQSSTRAIRDHEAQLQKEADERDEKDQFKSHVADVLSEVRLLQNLNHIPGFTVFRDLALVRGRPSSAFNTAWSCWNKARPRGKKSFFPDPAKKVSYDDTQLWAIIEMQDAGTDCEKLMEAGGLTSIWEVWDVFWGVACSMAKSEEGVRFEHRDLHLGNICVRSGPGVEALRVKQLLKRKMRFTGLETTVIDYTLSRADIIDAPRRRLPTKDAGDESQQDVAFLDLDVDPALFQGDASEEYQYEIYRYMRGAALFGNPLQWEASPDDSESQHQSTPAPEAETEPDIDTQPLAPRRSPRKNTHIRFDDDDTIPKPPISSPRKSARKHTSTPPPSAPPTSQSCQSQPPESPWRAFHPLTNLIWLHFLLHKLLAHLQTHNTAPSVLSATDLARQSHIDVEGISDGDGDAERQQRLQLVKKKALRLEKVLRRVGELLCPVALGREGAVGSVKEVVVLALEERWLGVGDVEG